MKNREKYKNELIKVCKSGGFKSKELMKFFNDYVVPTYKCGNYAAINAEKVALLTSLWLDEEYQAPEEEYQEPEVDWSKVENNEPILVRDGDDEEWNRAHFACYKDGKVHAWSGGKTSWTASSYMHWMQAKLAEPQKPEHDSCVGCKYEHLGSDQEPCKDCRYAYMDIYEPQE